MRVASGRCVRPIGSRGILSPNTSLVMIIGARAPLYLPLPSPGQRPRPSVPLPLPSRFRNESSSRTNSLRTTRTKNRSFLAAAVRLRSDGPSRRNSSYRPNYRDLPSATNKSHPRSLSLASCARGSTRRHRVHQTRNYQRETAFSEQRVI